MLIDERKYIEVKNDKRTILWYADKGYDISQKTFLINLTDLYEGSQILVRVQCDYCGKIIDVPWTRYIHKPDGGDACNECRNKKKSLNTLKDRQNKLYVKLLKACYQNGYILLTEELEIKNNQTYIEYICPYHGLQKTLIKNFINGSRCNECAREQIREKYKMNSQCVWVKVYECGGILTNPEDYINNRTKNLQIICPECGEIFVTSLKSFTQSGGQMCEKCRKTVSLGEQKIKEYLLNNSIKYISQKRFNDCKDKYPLPFDFYMPDYNICIEYQGIQHYQALEIFGGATGFQTLQLHDNIKQEFCARNNTKLIIIPYWDFNNISIILNKELILS